MSLSGNPRVSALLIADPDRAYALIGEALEGGDVKAAARKLGVDRKTLHQWIRKHPALGKVLEKARKERTP